MAARVGLAVAVTLAVTLPIVAVGVFLFEWGETTGGPNVRITKNIVDDFIINEVNPDNIRSTLRQLTEQPHLGGTEAEFALAEWVGETWRAQGVDEVHLVPYDVLLSYPLKDVPNLVRVVDAEGGAAWTSQGWQPPLYAPEEANPDILPNFNAYSAPGNVTGDVVYANFGREEDFAMLAEMGVGVAGRLVLARYGAVFRANIAAKAEELGALGLVLYPDPEQYAALGEDLVYPDTVYMPGTAAPDGTVKLVDGDPLTPFYPAVESAYRIPESEASVPRIPVQPISYNDARQILRRMGGAEAPESWHGGLNVTYRLGPGLAQAGWRLNLEVHTHNARTTTYNTIGVITGAEEPDRYVVLGNHRDAWVLGAVDPSSGTAAMLEVSRVLTALRTQTGWRPRRSIVLCSWGSEEYGLIGSMEWTEQFGQQLGRDTVAYLNVDMTLEGNYTFRALSAPLLYDYVFKAAGKVPNPDESEAAAGRISVYDTWLARTPDPAHPDRPGMKSLGAGSDYKAFIHNLGVPSVDLRFTHDPDMFAAPLYHTLYETFAVMDELYDQGFSYNAALARLWALMAVDIADSQVLGLDLQAYSTFLTEAQEALLLQYGDLIAARNVSMEFFKAEIAGFGAEVDKFLEELASLDIANVLAVRQTNDKIMAVERAFIDVRGLPGRPEYNHVVMAPSARNNYAGVAFAGLEDLLAGVAGLEGAALEAQWRQFEQHLAAVTHHVSTAAKVLTNALW